MKYTVILLILALSVTCTACAYRDNSSKGYQHEWIKPEKDIPEKAKLNRYMDNLITALDADDKDAVKELFASSAVESIKGFDTLLVELCDFYKGECTSIETIYGGNVRDSKNAVGDNKYEQKVSFWYIVTTTQGVYRFHIQVQLIDTLDEDNVGIIAIYLCEGTDGDYHVDGFEYGIFIIKD